MLGVTYAMRTIPRKTRYSRPRTVKVRKLERRGRRSNQAGAGSPKARGSNVAPSLQSCMQRATKSAPGHRPRPARSRTGMDRPQWEKDAPRNPHEGRRRPGCRSSSRHVSRRLKEPGRSHIVMGRLRTTCGDRVAAKARAFRSPYSSDVRGFGHACLRTRQQNRMARVMMRGFAGLPVQPFMGR